MTPADRTALPKGDEVVRLLRLWLTEYPTDKRHTLTRRQVTALLASLDRAEAELEQAFREGCEAGADEYGMNSVNDAVAAWRERRRKV